MKRFRRWLREFALRSTGLRELLTRAGDVIRENRILARESDASLLMAQEMELQAHNMRLRMNELLAFRAAEVACVNPQAVTGMRESFAKPVETARQFKERLWELELALEDRGWQHEIALANLEFSRYGVGRLIHIIRVYALKNPLIKRGAEICALYVFGRGVEIRCEESASDEVAQDFLKYNEAELGHIGLAEKETASQTDGAQYFGLATNKSGKVKIKMVDPLEIMQVITEPDDTSKIRYYLRNWQNMEINEADGTQRPVQTWTWYPSLEWINSGGECPATMGGKPVNSEMPVYRMHGGGSPAKWRWPVPPLYASVDWARAYKEFLEDWATVQRSLARFALMVETKGGPAAIAAYQGLLSTTFADGGTQIERNPPPAVASAHVSGPDNKITAFKSAGAQVAPEQARRLMLMLSAAQGMPETFYGDASTGSLATAQSLDRPTELKFREMQQRWMQAITLMVQYALDVSGATPGGRLKEARKTNPAPQPNKIVVKFPSVLEHDIKTMIDSICAVASMGGRLGIAAGIVDRRTIADLLLAEIGYENRGQLLDDIYGRSYDPANDVTDQRSQVPPQNIKTATGKALDDLSIPPPLPPPPVPALPAPGAPPAPKPPEPAKEALAPHLTRLAEAVEKMGARNGR